MRNFLLGLFLICICTLSFGQVIYSPDPVEVTADPSETTDIQADFELKNEGSDTVFLAWKLDVIDQPSGWQFYVCDTEICYNFDQIESSTERPNIIAPNSSIIIMFHTLPAEIEGVGEYIIKFFDVSNPDSMVVEVPVIINTIKTSNKNIASNGLVLFPNPATNFFRINTGDVVKKIDVYSVVGKKICSFNAYQGTYYDITNLNAGMYYVRLLDEKEHVIKVMKLEKS
jgi:hypothetical protein